MEDSRKTALKNGLRQLSIDQLQRVKDYDRPMALDNGNYVDGLFCPLAVGVGLDHWVVNPTNLAVSSILRSGGLKINNVSGVDGEFYQHPHRDRDLRIALEEVMAEKLIEEKHHIDMGAGCAC